LSTGTLVHALQLEDYSIFFGGFTAAKIGRRIRLAEFFSADIRRTKFGG